MRSVPVSQAKQARDYRLLHRIPFLSRQSPLHLIKHSTFAALCTRDSTVEVILSAALFTARWVRNHRDRAETDRHSAKLLRESNVKNALSEGEASFNALFR